MRYTHWNDWRVNKDRQQLVLIDPDSGKFIISRQPYENDFDHYHEVEKRLVGMGATEANAQAYSRAIADLQDEKADGKRRRPHGVDID